jgi:glycosyltransferase involved in cell wall biosynthesis
LTRPHRLLAVGPLPPPLNGMSGAFQALIQGLSPAQWNLTVVDLADRIAGRPDAAFAFKRMGKVAGAVAQFMFQAPQADLVYLTVSQSTLGFLKDSVMLASAHFMQKPVIVHLHGGHFRGFYDQQTPPMQKLIRGVLERSRLMVVEGEALKNEFSMVADWRERTLAVMNPCEVPLGQPRKAPVNRLRVLFLSNMHLDKGYLDVVEALRLLAGELPNHFLEVHFAGDFRMASEYASLTEMQNDFQKRLSQLPTSVQSRYHGVVQGEAKHTLLAQADVFVLPTYYINEGQPIAVMEALASGLPVIATRHRGIPEILPTEMAELFVPARDPLAIAQKLKALAINPSLYQRLSVRALERARDFSLGVHLERMEAVLAAALKSSVRSPAPT